MSSFIPGSILVSPYLNPGWALLISMAGGIISETGGVMSHGSIIARELGKPCIVSVKNASNIFNNGEKVYMNGKTGVIKKLQGTGFHSKPA
ncbi:MAG TPA: hypothetical protein ENN73_03680 [Firmicutes bacterium]|nr:hypothetical protein [Bacillota bacterium]